MALYGLVALSVLLLGARALVTGLAGSQAEVALWLSETTGLAVTVTSVHADWSGWSPAVAVEGVRLGEEERGVGIEHVGIVIDPWDSLRQGKVVPTRVAVRGLDLVLEELADGRIQVQGLEPGIGAAAGAGDALLLTVLSRIRVLDLDARRVVLRTPRLPREVVLGPLTARLGTTAGRDAVLEFEADVPASGGGRLRARADWDARGPATWYAEVEGLGLAYLRDWLPALPAELSGRAGLQLWAPRSTGGSPPLPRQFRLRLTGLALGEPLFDDLQLAGELTPGVATHGPSLSIRGRIERATSPRGPWPEAELALAIDGPLAAPTGLRLAAGFLRLDDLSPALLAFLPHRDGAESLRGDLTGLRLHWVPTPADPLKGVSLRADFSGLGLRLPAVALTSRQNAGRVALQAGRGRVEFRATDLRAEAAGGLGLLDLPAFGGAVGLERRDGSLRLSLQPVALAHPAATLGLEGTLLLPAPLVSPGEAEATADPGDALLATLGAIEADLELTVREGDLTRLHELLPPLPALAATRSWLQQQLQGGRIVQGRGLFRGLLGGWPHADASGHSELALDIAGGRLAFHPDWPVAEDIEARLTLRGAAFGITGRKARLLDVRLTEGTGLLADVRATEPTLRLNLRLAATGPATRRLMNASPLREGPGERLARVNVKGPLDYRLALGVPLYPGPVTSVSGEVRFAGNAIDVGDEMGLTHVRGVLPFTREDWGGGPPLEARYAGLPVTVTAGGVPAAAGGGTRIGIAGRADRDFIAARLRQHAEPVDAFFRAHGLWPLVAGETAFTAGVFIPPREARPATGAQLTIESTLEGLGIELPAPFGKPAGTRTPLSIAMGLDEEPAVREVQVRLGEVATRVRLRRERPQGPHLFAGAGVRLGAGEVPLPDAPVIAVRGALPTFCLTTWKHVLEEDHRQQEAAGPDLDLDFRIDALTALGQRFRELRVIGRRDNGGWFLALASPDADGRINWPRGGGPATFEFRRLALTPDPDAPAAEATNPATLPAIVGAADDFHYAGNALGRMRMSTRPLPDGSGLALERLQFESERFRVDASGQWLARGLSQRSTFRIEVSAPDLGHLLASFGYATGAVEGGRTRMVIDARWPGPPDAFRLDALSGEMELELGKGRLLDVNPAAGRLFGLLSLQALPRRLALDFGDLFLEGFAFDQIKGNFRLEAGNAYTDNLIMRGPSAEVLVTGRTGLAARDYDQRVRVKPALSEALPVAGAIFGPVGIGIGAALYLGQRIFREIPDAIDRLFARYYTITGPWTAPVITPVERRREAGSTGG